MKSLNTFISVLTFATLLGPAHAASFKEEFVDLDKAEDFAQAVLEIRQNKLILGDFAKGQIGSGDVFDAYDAVLEELLGRDFITLKVFARPDEVRVLVRDSESGVLLRLSSLVTKAREKADSSPSSETRILESLSLTIETATRANDATSGSFVALTRTGVSDQVTVGKRFGNFTLSVFGRLAGQDWTVGAKAQTSIDLGKGFTLGVSIQIKETNRNVINVTEGRYHRAFDRYASSNVRVQIDKSFSRQGIRTSAGVHFDWVGGAEFSATPQAYAFMSVGKDFSNARGEKIAKLDFLAMKELGMDSSNWMLALMGSFVF